MGKINTADEETAANSYIEFIVETLKKEGGVVSCERLDELIVEAFGSNWGQADWRYMTNKGRTTSQMKWQNQVAWAKVIGRKQELFLTHKGNVLLLPPYWRELWAALDHRSTSFAKRCLHCNKSQRLCETKCVKCGKAFPPSKRKVRRTPTPT